MTAELDRFGHKPSHTSEDSSRLELSGQHATVSVGKQSQGEVV